MRDLSVTIPARNEKFLKNTIDDVLSHREADTEIIVVLDGKLADPPIPQHDRVHVIYHNQSVGQRAATNEATRLSTAKYVMKVDAHCAFDQGFDRKLIEAGEELGDKVIQIPKMYNLHAFSWVCTKCGETEYQGYTHPCPKCGAEMRKEMVWKPRLSRGNMFYRFDKTLHFNYWGSYKDRPEAQAKYPEIMSCNGSGRFMSRKLYWELGGCDENHGSWGQEGTEWACKAWLSGGRMVANPQTWYAHMFRTQGGDFGFPYPNPGIDKARDYSRDLWFNNKWDKAIYPLSWLIEKFAPVPGWDLTKGVVYYTDNTVDETIGAKCRQQLKEAVGEAKIASVSLKPLDFGENITLPLERGYLTMAKQILAGLEHLDTDIVFFAEHDIIYHPSHFEFTPIDRNKIYYNQNVWQIRSTDGHCLYYTCNKLSQLCGYRDVLIKHFQERVQKLEKAYKTLNHEEFNRFVRHMGFEPGTHKRVEWDFPLESDTWTSKEPNLDIRHESNLTPSRWRQDQFKNQKNCQNWQESNAVPFWGIIEGRFNEFLNL